MKPGKCVERIERLRAVEREYQVAAAATEILLEALHRDPTLLVVRRLDQRDLRTFQARLQATYFIRLFAEFETGLRDYWTNGRGKNPSARIFDLIEAIASYRPVVNNIRLKAHDVRKYRNRLVHEEDAEADEVSIETARRYLSRFFGYLPPDW
jgi:hypothetical protein